MFIDWKEEDKKRYVEETRWLCDLLSEIGVQTHLQFGTLLGYVREGKLIDSDDDIDICYLSNFTDVKGVISECQLIYKKLYERNVLLRYWDSDYNRHRRIGKPPFGQAHVIMWDHCIDLFTSWKDISGNYWTCQYGNFGKTEFRKVTFYGYDFNIPTETNKILTRLFGDWKTPASDKPKKYIERRCYMKVANCTE
jgi:hypothetical protein